MPARSIVYNWLATPRHPFAGAYAQAREFQFFVLADELLEIADDSRGDYVEYRGENGTRFVRFDPNNVHHDELKIEVLKRAADRLLVHAHRTSPTAIAKSKKE